MEILIADYRGKSTDAIADLPSLNSAEEKGQLELCTGLAKEIAASSSV